MRLDLKTHNKDGSFPEIRIKGYTDNRLRDMLAILPYSENKESGFQFYMSLHEGDRILVKLKNSIELEIEANPAEQAINMRTATGRPVCTDLLFEPDWRPPEAFFKQRLQPTRPPKSSRRRNSGL